MWLINVTTRRLEEFIGSKIPPYAILSQTWEEEEVSYKQYIEGDYHWLAGFGKIDMTCRIAQQDGIGYAWVDTCCIDKSSSAELSEAIDSMFRWYQRAQICYVYLSDWRDHTETGVALAQCRWFTRGWTLQELIAPETVVFFDSAWETSPNYTKMGLIEEISAITKIDRGALLYRNLSRICVAQKMSWAAERTTTRIEDAAYCLLSIFNLHMPLLYGEEEQAFQRLQEEIIRSTTDLSILAWSIPESQMGWPSDSGPRPLFEDMDSQLCGVLAKSPADFSKCGQYERTYEGRPREFAISNVGIRTRLRLEGVPHDKSLRRLTLPLNCMAQGVSLSIQLKQISRLHYLRINPWQLHHDTELCIRVNFPTLERILLTHIPDSYSWSSFGLAPMYETMNRVRKFSVRLVSITQTPSIEYLQPNLMIRHPWPADRYDYEDASFFVSRNRYHDFGIIDATFRFHLQGDHTIKCAIITLGWAGSDLRASLFGIVDHNYWSQVVHTLRSQHNDSDFASHKLVELLRSSGVPRALSVQRQIDGTDLVAVVSIEPKLVQRSSHHAHFQVNVTTHVGKAAHNPAAVEMTWQPLTE